MLVGIVKESLPAYDCHLSTNIFTELQTILKSDLALYPCSQWNIKIRVIPANFPLLYIFSVQVAYVQFGSVPVKNISFLAEVAVMVLLDI